MEKSAPAQLSKAIQCKCISKQRDKNNRIINYTLQDNYGKTLNLNPDTLKSNIKANKLIVTNLTLTSDNRLVDKASTVSPANTPSQPNPAKQESYGDGILNKAKLLGLNIDNIGTADGKVCYLIHHDSLKHTLYIPSNIKNILKNTPNTNTNTANLKNYEATLSRIRGHLRVIGGENLTDLENLFSTLELESLNLSEFKPRIVNNIDKLFEGSKIPKVDISSLNLNKNIDIDNALYGSEIQEINISNAQSFNIEHLIDNDNLPDELRKIQLNPTLQSQVLRDLVKSIQEATDEYFTILYKPHDIQRTHLAIANKAKKIRFNKVIENDRLVVALLKIYVYAETIVDYFKDIIERLEKLSPAEYYNYEYESIYYDEVVHGNPTRYALNVLETVVNTDEATCKNNTELYISDITDKDILLNFYIISKDKKVNLNIPIERFEFYLGNVEQAIKSAIERSEREIESNLETIYEMEEAQEQVVEKFNRVKEYFLDQGVEIDIEAEVKYDGDIADVKMFGYYNADEFGGVITRFFTPTHKETLGETHAETENITYITYGHDYDIYNSSTDPDTFESSAFINTIGNLASKYIEGTKISLVQREFGEETRISNPETILVQINDSIEEIDIIYDIDNKITDLDDFDFDENGLESIEIGNTYGQTPQDLIAQYVQGLIGK